MSIFPQSVTKDSGYALPPVKPSLLSQAGTAIFDVLDAPGNFTRSLLAGDPANAAAVLLPFWEARRVPGSEVTGLSDDTTAGFFTNLGVEFLADPLLFVNSIAKTPKLLKELKAIEEMSQKIRSVRGVLSKTEAGRKGLQELEEAFAARKAAFKALKNTGRKEYAAAERAFDAKRKVIEGKTFLESPAVVLKSKKVSTLGADETLLEVVQQGTYKPLEITGITQGDTFVIHTISGDNLAIRASDAAALEKDILQKTGTTKLKRITTFNDPHTIEEKLLMNTDEFLATPIPIDVAKDFSIKNYEGLKIVSDNVPSALELAKLRDSLNIYRTSRDKTLVTLGVPFGRRFGIGELDIGKLPNIPFLTPVSTLKHERYIANKLRKVEKLEKELKAGQGLDIVERTKISDEARVRTSIIKEDTLEERLSGHGDTWYEGLIFNEHGLPQGRFSRIRVSTEIKNGKEIKVGTFSDKNTAIVMQGDDKYTQKFLDEIIPKIKKDLNLDELRWELDTNLKPIGFNGITGEPEAFSGLLIPDIPVSESGKELINFKAGPLHGWGPGTKWVRPNIVELPKPTMSKTLRTAKERKLEVAREKLRLSEKYAEKWDKGVLGLEASRAIRGNSLVQGAEKFSRYFRFESKDPFINALKETTKTEINKAIGEDIYETKLRMDQLIDKISELRNESRVETERRLVTMGENPLLRGGATLSPDIKYAQEANKIRKETKAAIGKLEKEAKGISLEVEPEKFAEYAAKKQALIDNAAGKMHKLKEQIERARVDRVEFIKQVGGKLLPEEELFLNDYIKPLEDWVPLAKKLGVKVDFLQSSKGLTRFVPRLLSKEAKALKASNESKYALAINELGARFSGSFRRDLFPELSINAVNQKLRKDLGIDFDFFRTDIADILLERRAEMHKVLNKAAAINVFVDTYGTTKKAAGKGAFTAERLFGRFGLDGSVVNKEALGKTIYLARDKVDDLDRIKTFFGEHIDQKFLKTFYSFTNLVNSLFQGTLTTLFPAYHTRNFINNVAMNMIAGVKSEYYMEALRLQRLAARGELVGKDFEIWKKLNEVGAIKAGQYEDYKRFLENVSEGKLKEWITKFNQSLERPVSSWITQPIRRLSGRATKEFRREQVNPLVGRAFGRYVEENSRIAHYLSKRAEGLADFEAMRSMNKWLFDYDQLTDVEKQLVRPLFLFYTWSRKNIPLMIRTSITNPRLGSIYTKITGIGEEEVPQYLNRGFAFKAPPIIGKNQYIGSLGLGIEDLNIFNVNAANPSGNYFGSVDQLQRVAFNIAQRLSPVVKIPLELTIGRDVFTGRPLADRTFTDWLNRNAPTSRFTNTASKMFDPKNSWASRAIDFTTGIRTYNVDPNSLKRDIALRRARGSGLFREYRGLTLTNKYKEDPEARRLQKELNKILKEVRSGEK